MQVAGIQSIESLGPKNEDAPILPGLGVAMRRARDPSAPAWRMTLEMADMTTTTPINWTHKAIAQAQDLHSLFLGGPLLEADERAELMAAPLEVRQAARTIAACVLPMAALPTDPELGPMLPLSEALRVLASDTAWLKLSADEADEVATDQLIALRRHYDVDHLSPVDVIAATLLAGKEIDAARDRCAALQADGDGDTALAMGLERAMSAASD
jgi:hypothetical protein